MNDVTYGLGARDDLAAVQALLGQAGVVSDGIELDHCLVAKIGSRIVGTVALEALGPFGLLRSLAVAKDCRGQSLGRDLCAKMADYACLQGVERLYLLTTDAEGYFAALGFERIERRDAPAPMQATTQFRSLCPQSAVCMTRDLRGKAVHASKELLRLRPDVPGAKMWAISLQHTMLTYFEVEPRSRFEPHSHDSEQITLVLTGELFFEVQGQVHCLKPGEVIAIPSSVPHAVWTDALTVTAVDAWSPVMKKYEQTKS